MTEQEKPQDAPPAAMQTLEQLEQKVDQLAESMHMQARQLKKGARVILLAGFVLVTVIVIYLGLIFKIYEEITRPEALAEMAQGRALETLPVLSKTLEDALRDAAPQIAEDAKRKTIAALPKIREEIENQMDAAADKLVDRLDASLDPILDEALKQTKGDIEEMINDLENEDMALELGKKLKEALAEKLAVEVDTDLDKFLRTMAAIEKKLVSLQTKEELTPEEAFEKELITTWAIFLSEAMRESLEMPAGKKPKDESGAKPPKGKGT